MAVKPRGKSKGRQRGRKSSSNLLAVGVGSVVLLGGIAGAVVWFNSGPAPARGTDSPAADATPVSAEAAHRAAMLKLVAAERNMRKSIAAVADAVSARKALPDFQKRCHEIAAAAAAWRELYTTQPILPGIVSKLQAEQIGAMAQLDKEFPDSVETKLDNLAVSEVWGAEAFAEMNEMGAAKHQLLLARQDHGTGLPEAPVTASPAGFGSTGQPGRDLLTDPAAFNAAPTDGSTPPLANAAPPTGFPPRNSTPPDAHDRPLLNGPPSPNGLALIRAADEHWQVVWIKQVLKDDQAEVTPMDIVDGKPAPGKTTTVPVGQLHQAYPDDLKAFEPK